MDQKFRKRQQIVERPGRSRSKEDDNNCYPVENAPILVNVSVPKKLRLDSEGREREKRKVSNREKFVDVGPIAPSPQNYLFRNPDYHPTAEVYQYESSRENSVHYINDVVDPSENRLISRRQPGGDNYYSRQRTVDTIIPSVPRLTNLASSVTTSKTGVEGSPPSSGRSEKLQRTLKSISLNERDPFPQLKAKIAKQREKEKELSSLNTSLESHDARLESRLSDRENQPNVEEHIIKGTNSNNNALSNSTTSTTTEDKVVPSKPKHTEEDAVQLNSSPESVVIRPIKRKVATAPEVNKATLPNRRTASSSASRSEKVQAATRSRSADTLKPSQAQWVVKTPGKPNLQSGKLRSNTESHDQQQKSKTAADIRPDSWRKGMAIVKNELRQKRLPQDNKLSANAKEVLNDLYKTDDAEDNHDEENKSDDDQKSEVKSSAVVKPRRIARRKREPSKEAESNSAVTKQKAYDAQAVREYMAKKKQEKKFLEKQEKKRQKELEQERQEKLKALHERSRKFVYRPIPSQPLKTSIVNTTYTSADVATVPSGPLVAGIWAPPTTIQSELNAWLTKPPTSQDQKEAEDAEDNENEAATEEGDTTLTEADLVCESPVRSTHSRTSSHKSESPLLSRNKAVEEEIDQLVQAARLRNQSAQRIAAQATPLKLLDQILTKDSPTKSPPRKSPILQAHNIAKSARLANLALTTAKLMSKMDMLKADLESSALSRSHSRAASTTNWLNTSLSPRSPRESVVMTRSQRLTSTHLDQPLTSDEVPGVRQVWKSDSLSSVTSEDHTHSTVSESEDIEDHTHSTVTTDSELSDQESELSSLDIRIREALNRPSKFCTAPAVTWTANVPKPQAKVAVRSLFHEKSKGDDHSVINTYLRKLRAEQEALSSSARLTSTQQAPANTVLSSSHKEVTVNQTLTPSSVTSSTSTQTVASGLTSSCQTDTSHAVKSDRIAGTQTTHSSAETTQKVEPSMTTSSDRTDVSPQAINFSKVSDSQVSSTATGLFSQPSKSSTVPLKHSHPISTHPSSHLTSSEPIVGASAGAKAPSYAVPTRHTTPKISPSGLDLALSAGITLLEGMNQQQIQINDVEKTRFSTLAQQETVALAQLLKSNREKHEQQLHSIRQRIREDELESNRQLEALRRSAEEANKKRAEVEMKAQEANKKREEAELRATKESDRLSAESSRKILEAYNESTRAFSEASRLLADSTKTVHTPASVVDSLRAQSEAVTKSLTSLVDQQRQQNLEILRLSRKPASQSSANKTDVTDYQRLSSSRSPQLRRAKSPRDSWSSSRDSRSPRDYSRSPRDSKSTKDSKSPKSFRSPRDKSRKKASSPASFTPVTDRHDDSTTSSSHHSDETLKTEASINYSDDFSSASETPRQVTSPQQKTAKSSSESIRDEAELDKATNENSISTASALSPVKADDSIQTDISEAIVNKSEQSSVHTESRSRSLVMESGDQKSVSTISEASSAASKRSDNPLHKVVYGAVKEVFKDAPAEQLHSDPAFYDKLRTVLLTLKDGGSTLPPSALSTPSKNSPLSSPGKPPVVAPLSPRIDRRMNVRRPNAAHRAKRTSFTPESESDESHSLLETASDTDQECQLSALQHQLEETKKRHALMKKARQRYEYQKKQDAYKKQIEYYEEDMQRMQKEMDELSQMYQQMHQSGSSAASSAIPTASSMSVRPQIKQPRAPSSSGSDNGSRQRHSSGTSDAELPTPQPGVIQRPLVGKSLGQLSTGGRATLERQRSDSGKSIDSEIDTRSREKTPDQKQQQYSEEFDSISKHSTSSQSVKSPISPDVPSLKQPLRTTVSEATEVKDTARTENEFTYSDSFEEPAEEKRVTSAAKGRQSSESESISESIIESIAEESVKSFSSNSGRDLLNLAEPTLPAAKEESDDVFKQPEHPRSRTLSEASSHTITEERITSQRSRSRSRSSNRKSRTISQASERSHSKSRSRSVSETRSFSSRSRSRTPSQSRSRSRSPSYSRSLTERSRSRSASSRQSHSRSDSIADEGSIKSAEVLSLKSEESERPLLDMDIGEVTVGESLDQHVKAESSVVSEAEEEGKSAAEEKKSPEAESSYASDFGSESKSNKEEAIPSEKMSESLKRSESSETLKSEMSLVDDNVEYRPMSPEKSEASLFSFGDHPSIKATEEPLLKLEIEQSGDKSISEQNDGLQIKSTDLDDEKPDTKEELSVKKQDEMESEIESEDQSEDSESELDDLLKEAYKKTLESGQQGPSMSLQDELAGLESEKESVYSARSDMKEERFIDELEEKSERLSTPSILEGIDKASEEHSVADSSKAEETVASKVGDYEEEVKDASEIEESLIADEKSITGDGSSSEDSRLTLGSKSPDFYDLPLASKLQERKTDETEPVLIKDSPVHSDNGSDRKDSPVDSESELDKVISTAAAAVESFASEIEIDELNQSQGDVGVSIMDETTPRSMMSLESSVAEELERDDKSSPEADIPITDEPEPKSLPSSTDTTPRSVTPTAELNLEAAEVKEPQEDAVIDKTDKLSDQLLSDSLNLVLSAYKQQKKLLKEQPYIQKLDTNLITPPISPVEDERVTTPIEEKDTEEKIASKNEKEIPVVAEDTAAVTKPAALAIAKAEDTAVVTKPAAQAIVKAEDKGSLLGELPPLSLAPPITKHEKSSDSSSEESTSPQLSPTKQSFVENARHEQWAQLGKDIDNVFGADSDWFDEDFGLTPENKSATGILNTKEILSRVVIPEPVFIVPHTHKEVNSIATEALDIFWKARRYGEDWSTLTPTEEFLSAEDKLGPEASSTSAFKSFLFDLVRDMLMDIYQNEETSDVRLVEPSDVTTSVMSRGPLNRYYKYRQPPTTVDEVRSIVEQYVHPSATGKLAHHQSSSNNNGRSVKSLPVARNKRRDKVDTILTQELREEEGHWLDYSRDELSVKLQLVDDIYKLLIDDSIQTLEKTYNNIRSKPAQSTTEL